MEVGHCRMSWININLSPGEAESIAGALRGINSAAEYGDVNGVLSYLFNNWELFGLRDRYIFLHNLLFLQKKRSSKRFILFLFKSQCVIMTISILNIQQHKL